MVVVVMGVCGSGKSTLGKILAERLKVDFLEGDDFHSPANVAKMSRGEPLTESDRAPWLSEI
ncbi:MAG: gluconokinase, partial [Verrucomicrobiota bacterium]